MRSFSGFGVNADEDAALVVSCRLVAGMARSKKYDMCLFLWAFYYRPGWNLC